MDSVRISAILLAAALAACGGDEPAQEPRPEPRGREETRAIRNTEAIGYPGEAMADKLDAALDKSEERKRQGDAAVREQTE